MGVDRVWIVAGQELPACRLMANQHRDADKILRSHKNKKAQLRTQYFAFGSSKKVSLAGR